MTVSDFNSIWYHKLPNGDVIRFGETSTALFVNVNARGGKWYPMTKDDHKVIQHVCDGASEVKLHMEGYTL